MPYKDIEKRKAYQKLKSKQYYLDNKERVKESSRLSKERARNNFQVFKASLSCTNLPIAIPYMNLINRREE